MDITSVSSYSEFIDFAHWDHNRDKETLPQINLLMLTGVKSHMSLYYCIISGSIKDMNEETIKEYIVEQEECSRIEGYGPLLRGR